VPPVLPTLYAVTSTSGAAGLVCVTVTPETAHEYGLDAPQGMAVTGVVAGGAADRAGLRPRDVILKIRGVEAHDLSALSTVAADSTYSQPVQIDIVRSGSRKVLQLQFNQQRG
jgi:S1-C subfamily serine protease